MSKKLYIGGLSYNTTDAELKEAFSQAGNVESATVVMDKFSGRSRGFGFVEMATDEEADAAIKMWNGQDLGGRKIIVNEARPLSDRPAQRGGGFQRREHGGGGFGGGRRDTGGRGGNW